MISTILHVLTMLSGLCFGACGLYFNVYDTLSTFTKTTVLVSMSKSIIGLYWILLGIYSHSLAARLISNSRVVDCIRLHSKTFMKINMVFVIAFLMTAVICLNIYTNVYLLDKEPYNETLVYKANCASIGLNNVLCEIYFISKIVYSVLSLCWNLMVAAICLSICRTLTVGVRRFIRELNFDSHIFEEHLMIQSHILYPGAIPAGTGVDENWTIWDDDIKAFEEDYVFPVPSSRETVLENLRNLRKRNDTSISMDVSVISRPDLMSGHSTQNLFVEYEEQQQERRQTIDSTNLQGIPCDYGSISSPTISQTNQFEFEQELKHDDGKEEQDGPEKQKKPNSCPPIISNQELMFTYFKLMRTLSSTSRLLQRWMSCWITFVLLWCVTLIIYWTAHSATLIGLLEFLIPVIGIGFMTSAYAEVNFEGGRILKCLVPTEDRMPVIYYFQNANLELKIFSFVMTYNVLVTVCAGVALTIATRIIIDQIS